MNASSRKKRSPLTDEIKPTRQRCAGSSIYIATERVMRGIDQWNQTGSIRRKNNYSQSVAWWHSGIWVIDRPLPTSCFCNSAQIRTTWKRSWRHCAGDFHHDENLLHNVFNFAFTSCVFARCCKNTRLVMGDQWLICRCVTMQHSANNCFFFGSIQFGFIDQSHA